MSSLEASEGVLSIPSLTLCASRASCWAANVIDSMALKAPLPSYSRHSTRLYMPMATDCHGGDYCGSQNIRPYHKGCHSKHTSQWYEDIA